MNKALQRYLEAATGLTNLTKAKAEQIAQQLVRQGEFASDNVGDVVEELLERQRRNREVVTALVKAETSRLVRAMGLATTSEVERLERQVADLKREVASAEDASETVAATSSAGAGRKTAKKAAKKAARTAASKTAAGKSAKKTAKKATKKATKKSPKKAAKRAAKKTAKKSAKKTAKKRSGSEGSS